MPLLIAACLLGTALAALPTTVAEELSVEEVAEEAALKEVAAEAGADSEQDFPESPEEGSGNEPPEEPIDEKDVVVLKNDTFAATLKKHQFALVRPAACNHGGGVVQIRPCVGGSSRGHCTCMRAGGVLRPLVRPLPGKPPEDTCCASSRPLLAACVTPAGASGPF